MKSFNTPGLWLMFFVISLFFPSCKPDHAIHKRDFHVRTATWYRVSPTHPIPLSINGVDYVGFAYFPGGGEGNASHMGKCTTFFNQLSYGTSPQAPPAGSIPAPLVDVINYPITGAPLPLIQAGDFSTLSAASSSLNIPSSVYNKIINQVIYNKKGDAIFISAISGSGGTFPISPTTVGFNGKALITGGRGKFSRAVGEIDYSGYFNVTDPNDAAYNAEGWIAY
ncbi:MAG: hypothetical protein ABI760_09730 [Ferruginibacter sp.]